MRFEKGATVFSVDEFQKLTGAKWVPTLDFEDPNLQIKLQKEGMRLHKKQKMSSEQTWLGCYFKNEILTHPFPDVAIRWIDDTLGWGVFTLRDFKKMEFIAEYVGKCRKRGRGDSKNSYCFEYVLVQGIDTGYTIDAMDQGGLSRYINHSAQPNLLSSLATFDHLSHVILYTKDKVAKGEQLCYDYGPTYWAKRKPPLPL